MKTNKDSSFFYGWVIIAISVVTGTLVYGVRYSFSVFFPEILAEFGWSRGSTALMMSLNLLVYGFMAPVAGTLGSRWKLKILMPAGVVLLALALIGCSFANRLWHFYVFFGVMVPVGSTLCAWPIISPALMNWFATRRGLVMGMGNVGGSLCFVYGLLAQVLIMNFGWRFAYLVLAVSLMAILLPLHHFFFHYHPMSKGLKAYGSHDHVSITPLEASALSKDWTLPQILRTHQIWLLVLCHFLFWGFSGSLILAHQVKYVEDAGYSAVFAVSVFALYGVAMLFGQLSGVISDWIGREKAMALSTVATLIGLFALLAVHDASRPWLLYSYALFFGYGSGSYTAIINAGTADIFYGKNFGTACGMLLTGLGFGGAIGPWFGGYLYDSTGSYDIAFFMCMACSVLATVIFCLAAPRNAEKLRAAWLNNRAEKVP